MTVDRRRTPASRRPAVARATVVLVGTVVAALGIASCESDFTGPRDNAAPEATMVAPAEGLTFRAGDTIAWSGRGFDRDEGRLDAGALAWWVELVRDTVVRTLVPRTEGVASGRLAVPTRGELWPDMRYRFHLEVRDRLGAADTVVRELAPLTTTIHLVTVPAGLQVGMDGASAAAPRELSAVVGALHDVEVASPQSMGDAQYVFTGWADGGARLHTITVPQAAATYTATFALVPPPNRPPTVSLTAPGDGATLTVGVPVTLRATASDADGRVTRVEFRANGTSVGVATIAPFDVSWTPSATGAVSLVAIASDDSGAVATSAAVVVNVTALPNVPPTVAITAPSSGSTFTVGDAITVRASAADPDGVVARVEFFDGATSLGVDVAAPFELSWVPTTAGVHSLAARATDDSAAAVTSASIAVTILPRPNQLPAVALSAPVVGSTLTVGMATTVRATATDPDGRVTQVEFLANGAPVGAAITSPFEISWTPSTVGGVTLVARATDDSGSVTTSTPVTVTVVAAPNVPPTVALTAPASGSSWVLGAATTLRAAASDADGRVTRVTFHDGATLIGTVTTAPFELAWTATLAGTHVLTAQATDDAGAITVSAPVSVTVLPLPNRAPSVTVTSPAAGATFVLGSGVTLAASASDADGTVRQVEFLVDGASVGIDASAPFTTTWMSAATGSASITARATDDSGSVVTSAAVVVTILPLPNVPPTVSITTPAAGATFVVGTPVTVSATGADADGRIVQVEFLANGTPIGTDGAAPFAVTWTPSAPGSWALTVRATDDSGAVGASAPVSVTVVAPNQPPRATITAPAVGATFRAGDVVTYAGTSSDAEEGSIPPERVTWWIDLHHDTHTHPFVPATSGAAGGTVTLPTQTETSASIWYRFHLVVRDTGGLADSVFRDILPVTSTMRFATVPAGLQVTVDGQPRTTPVDIVGVVGTARQLGVVSPQSFGGTEYVFQSWSDGGAAAHGIVTPEASTTYTATFAAVAPANQPPAVSITAPVAGATLTAGTAVVLRATATDADGTVAQVVFLVDGVPVGTTTASPFQLSWTPSVLGSHVVAARATDDDGDFALSAPVAITVQASGSGDVVAPTVQITSPANNAGGLTGAIVVQANASDDVGVAGVTFQVDGDPIGAEDTSAPYSATIPSAAAFTTGQHVIRARARDAAGNLSPWVAVTVGFGGSVDLPAGFTRTAFVAGLVEPTTMAFAPDGRLFIAEQGGRMRVVKNGVLLATPFHTFPTSINGERGLLGVAFDPDFATTRWVYAYYTAAGPTRNIVVRLRASATNGDVADASDIDTLLTLPNLSFTNHNGGALHFGPDGKLYVAVGDNGTETNAPLLTTTLGKLLRINADGSIPTDNPFFAQTTGINRSIWARGLRNPFTFGFQPGTGRMIINDVGQGAWEEVNEGVAGSNYGWPATEGYTTNPAYRSPLFAYPHSGGFVHGFAVVGAAFYDPPVRTFPASFSGDYFFGDYVDGWVNRMDLDNGNAVYAFARFPNTFVFDVRTGPDGALYVLCDNVNGPDGVWRIQRAP